MHLSALALLYAQAHVPLLKGASSGPNIGSLATALNTTQVGVLTGDLNGTAFFANRVSFCAWPYFWLSFAAPTTNYTLMVGGSVPVIERFQQIRVAAAVIGPGLPLDNLSQLPSELQAQIPEGMGAVAVSGVQNQTDCAFLDAPVSVGAYSAQYNAAAPSATNFSWGPRCFFREGFTSVDIWVVQDELVRLSAAGRASNLTRHEYNLASTPSACSIKTCFLDPTHILSICLCCLYSWRCAHVLIHVDRRHTLCCVLGSWRPTAWRAEYNGQACGDPR